MKRSFSVVSIALMLGTSAAMAADLDANPESIKDNVIYSAPDRAGFYFGVTAGYGWGSSEHFLDRAGDHGTASNDPDGGLFGVTAGYNYQLGERWVAGVEGDVSFGDISGRDGKEIFDGHHWHTGWGPLVTLRGRAGYTFGNALLYGTAGIGFMDSDEWVRGNTAPESAYNDDWKTAFVVGAGLEYAFTDNLTGKIEYLHVGLGESDGYDGNDEYYTFDNDLDIVRIGVNYKLN